MTIPLKTIITILIICNSLLKGRNYVFNMLFLRAYNTIINYANFVAVTNLSKKLKRVSKKLKRVFKKTRLNIVIEYKEEGCYLIKGF